MAEFQYIFCHAFLPSVLIIEGVDRMGGRAGWGGTGRGGWVEWEVAKTIPRDTP